jgi:hypothetical protein
MSRLSGWLPVVSPAVLGIGACAACCAVPLIAAVGGAGLASAVAAVAEPAAGVLLATSLVVGGVMVVRQRQSAASCETTGACSVDGGCGCGPALDQKSAREAGCTLDASAMPDRERSFRALFARGLLRREGDANRSTWAFAWSPELERDARALAAAESGCCSFFDFDLRRNGDELHWTTKVPAGREQMLGILDRMAAEAAPSA